MTHNSCVWFKCIGYKRQMIQKRITFKLLLICYNAYLIRIHILYSAWKLHETWKLQYQAKRKWRLLHLDIYNWLNMTFNILHTYKINTLTSEINNIISKPLKTMCHKQIGQNIQKSGFGFLVPWWPFLFMQLKSI